MLMNRRGQLGPQGLEDLPMVVMAFIAGIAALIMFFSITSARLTEAELGDMHNTGKRLVEQLSGEMFRSELDASLIDARSGTDAGLKDAVGPIEYNFWAEIETQDRSWTFGSGPRNGTLAYGGAVTVLSDDSLYDGEVIVRIWPR
jgi:hypothetical protein